MNGRLIKRCDECIPSPTNDGGRGFRDGRESVRWTSAAGICPEVRERSARENSLVRRQWQQQRRSQCTLAREVSCRGDLIAICSAKTCSLARSRVALITQARSQAPQKRSGMFSTDTAKLSLAHSKRDTMLRVLCCIALFVWHTTTGKRARCRSSKRGLLHNGAVVSIGLPRVCHGRQKRPNAVRQFCGCGINGGRTRGLTQN